MTDQDDKSLISSGPGEQNDEPTSVHDALVEKLSGGKRQKYVRFVIAALSSIPWIGGIIGAGASLNAEFDQDKLNDLQRLWLEEHKKKATQLAATLADIIQRLDGFGEEVKDRIESEEYLALVKRTFRSWDEADTQEKRQMFQKLITNAGAINLCPDDLIRLFISWIDQYHESHFMVIREIYKNPGITRGTIWDRIHGERVREDSAEADLFRYLIRDLSTGGVIRQERETTTDGQFMQRSASKRSRSAQRRGQARTMESAFEDTKPYVLTELGKQFVHYVMEDVVPQVESSRAQH